MHRLEYSEWQSGDGRRWYCNDVKELATVASKWWVPARMLGMSLTDYVLLLKDTFHANIEQYYEPTEVLIYSFNNKIDVHKFVLWINNQAKKVNYIV